jgi:hypothetical protein
VIFTGAFGEKENCDGEANLIWVAVVSSAGFPTPANSLATVARIASKPALLDFPSRRDCAVAGQFSCQGATRNQVPEADGFELSVAPRQSSGKIGTLPTRSWACLRSRAVLFNRCRGEFLNSNKNLGAVPAGKLVR